MAKSKTLAEFGRFKEIIHAALYKSENIREVLLGDISKLNKSEIMSGFKKRVKSHLFIDDTVTDTDTYIYYDVDAPNVYTHIKDCRVIMYVITHRDTLENYSKEGYSGNRIDILCEMIEDVLLNNDDILKDFGIGDLNLTNIGIYNATRFYGRILTFEVPSFR